ncbi:PREDICTED: apolipoprotein A-IV-like [Camelina sativa]|uniref:Apolipoprotein A-IV-like n=1 Tax=Camelina sativa TaxID=90675 RepID=A0ABM0WKN4_CAMSA|nr:PREDICTED: apolipoprotein A-IV-like [Camelina sativa]
MAAAKLVALLLFLALVFNFTTCVVFADAGIDGGEEPKLRSDGGEIELDQLNSKIRALESQIDEKTRELKGREELVADREKLLQERQAKVASLETEVSSLKKKGSSDSVELLSKAQARAAELEKQVEVLKNFLEQKNKEKESTEARSSAAEKKLNELNSRLEKFHKTNEEQKNKIRKLERALKLSEEEMVRTKNEATTKAKELMEVHGAWLPPWLVVHWAKFQTVAGTHWDAHGKPVLEKVTHKVTQAKNQAEKWAKPHMANVKTKYIPAMKETVKTHVEPHVQTLSTKAKEAYHASKSAVTPHIVKFQEHVDPYYQEAKKFSKPYVDQVATATKPHVDKVRATMKPYTKKVVHIYKESLKSASTYHHQLQANVERKLKSHELMEPFATKEFIWFTASALLALPIFIVYKFLCSLFCTKTKKPIRQPHHHTRRKAKRGHSDK